MSALVRGAAALGLAVLAGSATSATLDFEVIRHDVSVSTTTYNPFAQVNSGVNPRAIGFDATGTLLVDDYDAGTQQSRLVTLSGGSESPFAETGPAGLGDVRLFTRTYTQGGDLLSIVFDNPTATRSFARIGAGGTVQTIMSNLETIGTQEFRPLHTGYEVAGGVVLGGAVRDVGGSGNNFSSSAIVAKTTTGTSVIAQAGSQISGVSNIEIGFLVASEFSVNGSGQIVFDAGLAGAGVDTSTDPSSGFPTGNRNGLILADGGTLSLIVSGGDPAPDGLGTFSQFIGRPQINDNGDILFVGRTYDAGTGTFTAALFLKDATGLTTIAKPGDPIPGSTTGDTIRYANFDDIVLLDDGTIFFVASTEQNGQALLRLTGAGMETLLTSGETVTFGAGLSDTLQSFDIDPALFRSADDFVVNAGGSSLFEFITDPVLTGVTTNNRFILRSDLSPPVGTPSVPLPAGMVLGVSALVLLGAVGRRRPR